MRGVAEHEDPLRRKLDAALRPRAGLGERAELVPVMMIVGERAELEVVPHAVVPQLDLRAAREIAREQREHDVGARLERVEQRQDARQQAARRARDFLREMVQVAIEKSRDVFRRRRQPVRGQHLAHDAGIRAARDLDGRKIVINPEAVAEPEAQRALPRAAGGQQGAVDVEQEKFVGGRHSPAAWRKLRRLSSRLEGLRRERRTGSRARFTAAPPAAKPSRHSA